MTIELPRKIYYHGSAHSHDVFSAAGVLAEEEKINPFQTQLILTVASNHDSGFCIAMPWRKKPLAVLLKKIYHYQLRKN